MSRWASRTSNPLGGINSVFGGFDSHALPPALALNFLVENPFVTNTAGYLLFI